MRETKTNIMNDNLDYTELICELNPNLQKHAEVLIAYLNDLGFESFMETEKGINAYIPQSLFNKEDLHGLESRFPDFKLKISHLIIKDEKWNESWTKHYFEPIIFGNELVVRASFHPEFPNAKKEIIIDPKTAFGTGYHGTTYMLIEEILKLDMQGKSVLDMGTGTGILAILSKMQASGRTVAVDNDPKAIINTKENIIINNTPDIEVLEGEMSIINESFDIIYENIWKNIVINDMPKLANSLNMGGVLLTSGFYYKEFKEVKKAGEKQGLNFISVREKDDWAMVKFVKG
ncbi:MAG: 50S ribosomal protein L11 methyltransferase [Bacteroidetes bacterium]|nr:MAG: 50S ribosomal protein L11 methyltransferase [Bacteroidota bacterium]